MFFDPIFIMIGLIGNAIIIIIMPRKEIKVGKSPRFYYISVAVADFINIFNSWFLWAFFKDSLYMWTDGKYSINIAISHIISCRTITTIWVFSEIYSDYSVLALSIERVIALFNPLKAKSILTRKIRFLILVVILMPAWLLTVPFVPFVMNIIYAPGIHLQAGSVF